MRMSPGRFNGMLREMGQDVLWRRAAVCPCRNAYSGAAVQGCPVCQGKGVTWDATATAAWTGLAGMKVMREWAAFGLWESGDVILTIPGDSPLYAATEHDRVVMSQSSEPFSQPLTRGAPNEFLTYPVVSVDRVFWLSLDGATIIEGGIPAVSDAGVIDWSGAASQPDPGTQYSITGRKNQEYFIFKELPQDRAHFGG